MKDFYIYQWVRKDRGTIFYIGKGKNNRAFNTEKRNKYFKNILKITPCEVSIIIYNLTESEAFSKEIELIKSYKEKDQCEANLTDGGEGTSGIHMSEAKKGMKVSEETKAKMSLAHTNISDETRKKLRDSRRAYLERKKQQV